MSSHSRSIHTAVFGNAIKDLLATVPPEKNDDILQVLGAVNGSGPRSADSILGGSELVQAEQQSQLLHAIAGLHMELSSGGSVINSGKAEAGLGGKVAAMFRVGSDVYGHKYVQELTGLNIVCGPNHSVEGHTGTAVVLVTLRDGQVERTMRVALGVAAETSADNLDENIIKSSRWLLLEAYLLANGQVGKDAMFEAIRLAQKTKTPLALTLASEHVCQHHRDELFEIIDAAGLVLGNKKEAMALTGSADWQSSFEALRSRGADVIVTDGGDGALVGIGDLSEHVPAHPLTAPIIDVTGAGDAFAGVTLWALANNTDPLDAVRLGALAGARVVTKMGASLTDEHLAELTQSARDGIGI